MALHPQYYKYEHSYVPYTGDGVHRNRIMLMTPRQIRTKTEGVTVYPDATLLLVGIIILLASLISLRLGLSVAIIELILGAFFGNLGVLHVESWMSLVAGFGGHPFDVSRRNRDRY